MAKAKVIFIVGDNDHAREQAYEDWLAKWRAQLSDISEGGCGCCVIEYELEGPEEVLATLPADLRYD